jgi:phosphopantetheine adenylyltransferase
VCPVLATYNICPINRPYIIVDKGKPLVKQHHISELILGVRNFQDFLNEGSVNDHVCTLASNVY